MVIEHNDAFYAEAYEQALALLRRCQTKAGFLASPVESATEARIRTRDGVMAGLAALASGDAELIKGMKHTLDTIAAGQGKHGEVPSNISPDLQSVSYGRLAGRVDAPLWYVIGVCAFLEHEKHNSLKVHYWLSVERALYLVECWEYNDRSLIYTPLSGNWADEYLQQGYVLADQILYEIALRSAAKVFSNKEWLKEADTLRRMLEINYWPRASLQDDPLVYHTSAYHYQTEQGDIPYWLPSFSSAGYEVYFDGLAHALALLIGLGDDEQRVQTESYVQALEGSVGSPLLPAFWPVILPDDPRWNALELNHLYGEVKNQPYLYHNGGLWPMVTSLYCLGLVRQGQRERALHMLAALNQANARGREGREWEFAEFHHGQTYEPLGNPHQLWSATAGILAYHAVQGTIPWPL
jgi:hypothetical protein